MYETKYAESFIRRSGTKSHGSSSPNDWKNAIRCFWRLVKFLGKKLLGNKFTITTKIFTDILIFVSMKLSCLIILKLPYNEAKFWDVTIQNSGNILGQTSLKSTLSLISGYCVYSRARL